MRRPARLAAAGLALLALGCTSPEMGRQRGAGPGADVGNRGATVRTHEGSDPFDRTPRVAPIVGPSLDEARHAKTVEGAAR